MRSDIVLNKAGNLYDLDIRDGDIVIGESDVQHVEHILLAYPGSYKQWPILGGAIMEKVNSNFDENEKRELLIHLKSDGYSNIDMDYDYNDQNLKIYEAKR